MDKISTACSYTVSCGSFGYWFMHWLLTVVNAFTPDQWTAIGVIGSLLFAALTFIANIIFKVYDRYKNIPETRR